MKLTWQPKPDDLFRSDVLTVGPREGSEGMEPSGEPVVIVVGHGLAGSLGLVASGLAVT